MPFSENIYRESKLANSLDPRIPDEIVEMAENSFLPDNEISELIKFECEKTEELKEFLDAFNNGFANLVKDTGLELFPVSIENIHIIETGSLLRHRFEQSGKVDGALGGFIHDGHMYLRDDLEFKQFLKVFSHEYMHLVSKYKKVVEVYVSDKDLHEPMYGARYRILKTGSQQTTDNGTEEKRYGIGLNEAITEYFALGLRINTQLANNEDNFDLNSLQKSPITYLPHIEVLKKVVKKYLELDLSPGTPIYQELMRFYIGGDPSFIKKIAEAFRIAGKSDGLKTLFAMNDSVESAKNVLELI